MFHRTKHLILIAVGAAALAGGPAAVVASAEPVASSGYDCTAGKTWFDQRAGDYTKLKDSNPKAAGDAKKDAQDEKDRATKAGCDTSTWTVPKRIITLSLHLPVSPISRGAVSHVSGPAGAGSVTPVAQARSSRTR